MGKTLSSCNTRQPELKLLGKLRHNLSSLDMTCTYVNTLCGHHFTKMFLTITFELNHVGWQFWCLDVCFEGQGIRWYLLILPIYL